MNLSGYSGVKFMSTKNRAANFKLQSHKSRIKYEHVEHLKFAAFLLLDMKITR